MVEAIEVNIRPAKPADLPAMEWEGEYSQYRRVYQRLMEEMGAGKRMILVAEVDGAVVGQIFIQYHVHRADLHRGVNSAYLHAFRVRPPYRNRGIGTNLILAAEALLRKAGYERAVIAAAQENPGARRLYERLGYRFFRSDPGRWSFLDHQGRLQSVHEPSDLLEKWL